MDQVNYIVFYSTRDYQILQWHIVYQSTQMLSNLSGDPEQFQNCFHIHQPWIDTMQTDRYDADRTLIDTNGWIPEKSFIIYDSYLIFGF